MAERYWVYHGVKVHTHAMFGEPYISLRGNDLCQPNLVTKLHSVLQVRRLTCLSELIVACQSLDCQQSADICSLELGGVGGGAVTRRDTYGEGGKEGWEGGREGGGREGEGGQFTMRPLKRTL